MPNGDPDLVRSLSAEREIARVIHLYCRAIDRRDPTLLRSLYHDDAWDDHGDAFRGDADAFVSWAMGHIEGRFVRTMHTVHNTVVDLDGDSARGETYCIAHHVMRGGGDDLIMDVFACRYLDRFEDRPDVGWRIAHRMVVCEWRLRQPMMPEQQQRSGFIMSVPGPTDLVYADELPRGESTVF